ncbi:MAG TPA: basic amino acid ABC transporter substrate-binding protein [Actinomycetota bacterium]|jgi:polar amino acid transport system substrate-binding protein
MRTRFSTVLALLAAVGLVVSACAKNGTTSSGSTTPTTATTAALTLKTPGKLTIGSCLDYKPFEYKDPSTGQLVGFDVEIMDAIAQKLGLEPVWVKANFNTIFTALAGGQFDTVAAASTITPERQQVVDFSNPYYNARQSLTVNTTKTPSITSTDQLTSGMSVGVQKGTTGEMWAKTNLQSKGIVIKSYTNAPDAFTDLEAGRLQGVINDEPSSEQEVTGRAGLKVVEPIDTGEHYGFAVGKSHPDVRNGINTALAAIIANGTYTTIFQKYFPGVPVPPEYGG